MKFEYKFLPIRLYGVTAKGLNVNTEKQFNELGQERWELVNIQTGLNSRQMTAIFKREVLDE